MTKKKSEERGPGRNGHPHDGPSSPEAKPDSRSSKADAQAALNIVDALASDEHIWCLRKAETQTVAGQRFVFRAPNDSQDLRILVGTREAPFGDVLLSVLCGTSAELRLSVKRVHGKGFEVVLESDTVRGSLAIATIGSWEEG